MVLVMPAWESSPGGAGGAAWVSWSECKLHASERRRSLCLWPEWLLWKDGPSAARQRCAEPRISAKATQPTPPWCYDGRGRTQRRLYEKEQTNDESNWVTGAPDYSRCGRCHRPDR